MRAVVRDATGVGARRPVRSEVIVLCVPWYLRYPLSYRDLEEMMAERGLAIDSLHNCPLGSGLLTDPKSANSTGDAMAQPIIACGDLRTRGRQMDLYRAIDSAGTQSTFCCRRTGI